MNPTEAGRCLARLMAAFPNPAWSAERTALYASELGRWSARAGERAVVELVRGADRCPSVAQLVESCRLHTEAGNALPRGHCHLCEDGWVLVDPEGRTTVAKCPNGCVPNALATPRHRAPMSERDLEHGREKLAEMVSGLGRSKRIPGTRAKSARSKNRYKIDKETGEAEVIGTGRSDLA